MLEATKAKRLPHPLYSPSIAPCDFFIFGYLKEKVTDFDSATREELQSAITVIFDEIGKDRLAPIFRSWMERLKCVIKNEGRYYHR
jgi:hypothetical protein